VYFSGARGAAAIAAAGEVSGLRMAREKAGAGTLLDPAAGGSSDEKRENGKTSKTRRVAAQALDRLLASIIFKPAFLMALPCMLAEFRRLVNP
jgi:hypothetical protein